MDWEFEQIELVRHDVMVMIVHTDVAIKYKSELDKTLYETISIDECREKIKLKREGMEDEGGDDKTISDTEVYA